MLWYSALFTLESLSLLYLFLYLGLYVQGHRERSGSVVGCLTRDREAAGSSLTGVTLLCP